MGLLERVGLRRRANDAVRAFSRGLQQRMGIARVLLHDPSLILLDEPYTGLDAQPLRCSMSYSMKLSLPQNRDSHHT